MFNRNFFKKASALALAGMMTITGLPVAGLNGVLNTEATQIGLQANEKIWLNEKNDFKTTVSASVTSSAPTVTAMAAQIIPSGDLQGVITLANAKVVTGVSVGNIITLKPEAKVEALKAGTAQIAIAVSNGHTVTSFGTAIEEGLNSNNADVQSATTVKVGYEFGTDAQPKINYKGTNTTSTTITKEYDGKTFEKDVVYVDVASNDTVITSQALATKTGAVQITSGAEALALKNVGTQKIQIESYPEGKYTYGGTAVPVTFAITARDFNNGAIAAKGDLGTIANTSDLAATIEKVGLYDSGINADVANSDFKVNPDTITYSLVNNSVSGSVVTADITGQNNYTASTTKIGFKFTYEPTLTKPADSTKKPTLSSLITNVSSRYYDGSSFEDSDIFKIEYGTEKLDLVKRSDAKGKIYTVEYKKGNEILKDGVYPLEAGSYTVTVKSVPNNEYVTGDKSFTFTVSNLSLNDAEFELESNSTYFNGDNQRGAVSGGIITILNKNRLQQMKNGSMTNPGKWEASEKHLKTIKLYKNTDFKEDAQEGVNAGNYSVTVNGRGSCTGSKSLDYVIKKVSFTNNEKADVDASKYNNFFYCLGVNKNHVEIDEGIGLVKVKTTDNLSDTAKTVLTNNKDVTYKIDGTSNTTYTSKNILNNSVNSQGDNLNGYKGYIIIYPSAYTGSPVEPRTEVHYAYARNVNEKDYSATKRFKDVKLEAGVNYNFRAESNTNMGDSAIANFTGTSNFEGERVENFSIVKSEGSISNAEVTLYKPDDTNFDDEAKLSRSNQITYTGADQKAHVKVEVDLDNDGRKEKKLTQDENFIVEYSDAANTDDANDVANAGEVTVTVIGIGTYAGETKATYTIQPKKLSESDIHVNPKGNATFNGIPWELAVEVTDDGAGERKHDDGEDPLKMKETRDYTLSYDNNVNAGKAKVSIKGVGNYTGTKVEEFTIDPCPINDADKVKIGSVANQIYTGDVLTPDVDIEFTDGEGVVTKLVKDVDYTLSYTNNTALGRAVMTINGAGNFNGNTTTNFTIVDPKYDIANATVIMANDGKVDFDGKAHTASVKSVSMTIDGTTTVLRADTDYKVATVTETDAGVYPVKISAVGNTWGGVYEAQFEIVGKDLTNVVATLTEDEVEYDGEVKNAVVKSVMDGTTELKAGTDYDIVENNAVNVINAGDYTLKIEGRGAYAGYKTELTFTIKAKDIANATINFKGETEFDFDGTAKGVEIESVTLDGKVLTPDVDYTVEGANASEKGTHTVVVTGIGNYAGTVKADWTIKGEEEEPAPVVNKVTKNNTIKVTVKAGKSKKKPLTVKIADKKTKKTKAAKKYAISKLLKVTKGAAKSTVTYTKKSGNKNFKIDKNTGKITVAKGTKVGTYKLKIAVKAAKKTVSTKKDNVTTKTTYKAKTVTKTVYVKVAAKK